MIVPGKPGDAPGELPPSPAGFDKPQEADQRPGFALGDRCALRTTLPALVTTAELHRIIERCDGGSDSRGLGICPSRAGSRAEGDLIHENSLWRGSEMGL